MNIDPGSDRFTEAWPPELVEALFEEAREARRTANGLVRRSRQLKTARRSTQHWNHRVLFQAQRERLRHRMMA